MLIAVDDDPSVGQVRRVDRRRARAQDAFAGQQPRRCDAEPRLARFVLRRLLGEVKVQRHAPFAGIGGNRAQRIPRHRAHAVDRGTDAEAFTVGQLIDAVGPTLPGAVVEAALHPRQRAPAHVGL